MGKYYVVFTGKKTGIFNSWNECKEQTLGVKGAKFKSYKTYEEARNALSSFAHQKDISKEEINSSISVDASCLGSPGPTEYRVVHTRSGQEIYTSKQYPMGTNNLGEFLALVEAMKYVDKKNEKNKIIFTDSVTAISWVNKKRIKTNMERNELTEVLFKEIDKALEWLEKIDLNNFRLMKWETHLYGEIKADYDRK